VYPDIGRRFAPTRWLTMTSLKAKTPKQSFGVYLYLLTGTDRLRRVQLCECRAMKLS
jgi:hypothetical protein